jgi:hypothetical protein
MINAASVLESHPKKVGLVERFWAMNSETLVGTGGKEYTVGKSALMRFCVFCIISQCSPSESANLYLQSANHQRTNMQFPSLGSRFFIKKRIEGMEQVPTESMAKMVSTPLALTSKG